MRLSPTVLGLAALSLAGLGLGPVPKPPASAPAGVPAEVATPVALAHLLTQVRQTAARGSDAIGTLSAEVDGSSLEVDRDPGTSGRLEATDDGEIFRILAAERLGRPSEFSVALLLAHGAQGWQIRGAEVRYQGEVYRARTGTVQVSSFAGGTLVGQFSFVATRLDAPLDKIQISSGQFKITPNQ